MGTVCIEEEALERQFSGCKQGKEKENFALSLVRVDPGEKKVLQRGF